KILSYLTYFSILFHAVDGIMLTIQNKKARPVGYVKNNAAANSTWQSRNMAVLGTLLLVFIATHMVNFWAKMHFSEMPLQQQTDSQPILMTNETIDVVVYNTTTGSVTAQQQVEGGEFEVRTNKEFYIKSSDIKFAEGYKDLYKITVDFFKDPSYGLVFTL